MKTVNGRDRAVNLCCVRLVEGKMVKEPIRVVPELTEIQIMALATKG